MAGAAPSSLASSVEKTNGAKLSRLLIDGGTSVLRKVFDGYHPPAKLAAHLNACYSVLDNLYYIKVLNNDQWNKLFPPGGVPPDSHTFDITLLFILLTNICGLSRPRWWWNTNPHPSDISLEANLARIKFYRNELYGHITTTGVDIPTFSRLWKEVSAPLVALGLHQTEIDRLKAERSGEENCLKALRDWANSEENIKSQLQIVNQTQTKTQQAVEDVCRVQTTTQQTVEKVHQTLTKTQEAVEEGREALQDSNAKLEEVRQSQTITQQAIDEVRQTQMEDHRTLQDATLKIREVEEAVGGLQEGRNKDRADEVLCNLAKAKFKGDIEYYMERFQAGTREWVFNRVKIWLDDRSSRNRVLVITGIAGMGKSVIAAVICERMQEAGRLSGSRFCRHNNPRYNDPQLMLQSLACHLSHALPEYKQALVKQLSRNHRTHLNNMNLEELFALLFKEPLNSLGGPGQNMLIVIDGLDESNYKGRNDLLDVIANQLCKLPSWIRFLVTTRPATNITEKLKDLNPLQLETSDEKNVEDIRTVLQRRLQHLVKPENLDAIVEKLVLKCQGLMLYAHFLILYLEENPDKANVDESFPLGISSVYHSYFKRLEDELKNEELGVKEENFLNLLCAITAAREALPVGFVSKVLVPSRNSPLAKRKVLRALSSVSSLLPIRDDCLHVIHKSVKDWLTDSSCYEEQDFPVDEKEGHHILSDLCTDELDDLKRRGARDAQFGATGKYALIHGASHMFHSHEERRPQRLEELIKSFVIELELVYAKLCVNSTAATKDLLWLQREGISTVLSEDIQSIVSNLLFLLRKYHHRFIDHPRMFLQTMLNEGGTMLSAEASDLLQNKYPEIPHMEYALKETQRGAAVVRFQCSSRVVCLDVSPKLDFMVCECDNRVLQLWSLYTGELVWERPVQVTKSFSTFAFRTSPSPSVLSFYRSVTFHPSEDLVLPGILSHAYTFAGDFKPLFLESKCRFSVCSISRDKTKILTDCPDNAKCIVMWNLKNGLEIAQTHRSGDVLSFACSQDGRLLAISHSNGLICLVDMMADFRTLAQIPTRGEYGVVQSLHDERFLFCGCEFSEITRDWKFSQLIVSTNDPSFSFDYSSSQVLSVSREFKSFYECGFLLGDPFAVKSVGYFDFEFVLNKQALLSCSPVGGDVKMLNSTEETKNSSAKPTSAQKVAFSLDGQSVYVISYRAVAAWDVSSGELTAEKTERVGGNTCCIVVDGVVLEVNGSLELWNFHLSECVRSLINLPCRPTEAISVSDERVACVTGSSVIFLETTSGKIVTEIPILRNKVVACNSKCQVITIDHFASLQLSDVSGQLWKKDLSYSFHYAVRGTFSPTEQFVAIWMRDSMEPMYVLDSGSGRTVNIVWKHVKWVYDCKFVSDEECVVHCTDFLVYRSCLRLLNVKSGDLLSVIDLENFLSRLAACRPSKHLIALGLENSTPSFKVMRVWLPRDKDIRKRKGMNNIWSITEKSKQSRK